ncbi:MAG TPA: site-specific integrase [Sporichthyaceae bacterium]|jgi:integrase|nr:site-specific integrase [Sporichthyaceae bacterium]
MGHVLKTEAGSYRANWRDPAGRQRAKTFRTKKEATGFLAEVESAANRGSYVNPHAGRARFGDYAERWLQARTLERTTADRDRRVMRNHVQARWQDVPLAKIDHLAVQAWVTELGTRLAPATVAQVHRLMGGVMRSALRDRLIGHNPCEGLQLPRDRKRDVADQFLTREEFARLLPEIPDRYRALVALSAGTGLRWGECLGLRCDAIDLDEGVLRVLRVATEVNGFVLIKPYPKSKAGRREVPLPGFVVTALGTHRAKYPTRDGDEIFANEAGGPLRRSMFRSRVWRPALVRAGLLGKVVELDGGAARAEWTDPAGLAQAEEFGKTREAVAHVARYAAGGVRFHDLRHSYATWLISDGVPINDVAAAMGHEQVSTTLNRYTHPSDSRRERVRAVFADFLVQPEQPDGS